MGSRQRRVVWSVSARLDLDEAAEYIAQDSPRSAAELVSRLLDAAASLAQLPDRGRIVPERDDPEIRELLVHPYRLIYLATSDSAFVLGVLHQRRDFERSDVPRRGLAR